MLLLPVCGVIAALRLRWSDALLEWPRFSNLCRPRTKQEGAGVVTLTKGYAAWKQWLYGIICTKYVPICYNLASLPPSPPSTHNGCSSPLGI